MAENEGQQASGEEVRPQETERTQDDITVPSDTPRDESGDEKPEGGGKKAEPEKPKDEKPKRNRTGEYINRLQTRIRDLESDLKALQAKQPEPTPEPTLAQSNFDQDAHARALAEWSANQAVERYRFQQQHETAQRRLQEVTDGYNAKVAEFAVQHPDFAAKVNAIPYQPSEAVQLAIMTHENGPEIAYALANDDDLAFQLASIQPHLAAAAVDRLASRLTAAPQVPQQPPAQPATQQRPVSQAPPPVPTVSGKTPTKTPEEKLTDDQWYAQELAKQRHKA